MRSTPVEVDSGALVALAQRAVPLACFFFLAVHWALRPVVRRFPSIQPVDRGDWLNRVLSITHAMVTGSFSLWLLATEEPCASLFRSILTLTPAPVDYVHGTSARLAQVMPWEMAYLLYDTAIMAIDPVVYMGPMVVHHVGALLVWPIAVYGNICHVYVLHMLVTELSSPLLHVAVFYLPKHGHGGSPAHIATGIALVIVFFLIRVLPIPFLAYSWWASRDAFLALPAPFLWTAALSLPIPAMLNAYWFRLMVHGAIKQLSKAEGTGDSKGKRD